MNTKCNFSASCISFIFFYFSFCNIIFGGVKVRIEL